MQDHGLDTMLKILQSPMGAALIPQMNQRENMVMDRAGADLQSVLTNTTSEADRNRRANEMQPYDIAAKQAGTEGQVLGNRAKQNDLGVFDARGGVAGAVKRADDEDDFTKIKRAVDMVGPATEFVKRVPVGQKKAAAAQVLRQAQMPQSVLDALDKLQEEQIDGELTALQQGLMAALPKVAIAGTQAAAKVQSADIAANARKYVADKDSDTKLRLGELKRRIEMAKIEAKKATAAAKGAGGSADAVKNSTLAAQYFNKGVQALMAGDKDTADQWFQRADEFSKLLKRKDEKPEDNSEQITEILDADQNVMLTERKRKVRPTGGGSSKPATKDNDPLGLR